MALGVPKVSWLLEILSGRDFTEWMAYAELEPFGEERADLRMAILASLIFNANRDPEKTKALGPQDFMPKFEEPSEEEPTIDREAALATIEERMMALVIATGGQDLRKGKPKQ